MEKYQEVKRFKCKVCSEVFENENDAKKHSKRPVRGVKLPRGLVIKERREVFYPDRSHKEHWGILIVTIPSYLGKGSHYYSHREILVYASTGERCPKKGVIDVGTSSTNFLSKLKKGRISFLSENDFKYFEKYFERHPELHFEYYDEKSRKLRKMDKSNLIRKLGVF